MKEFLYKLLNIATLGRGMKRTINGHTLRLPTRFYRFFPDNYEKDNFKFVFDQVKPGDTVLDCGAHIGLFAVIASQATGSHGKVYAFEPSPTTNKLLQKSIAINKAGGIITPFQNAIGGEVGTTTFFVSDGQADNSNSLVQYKEDRPLHGISINVITIDSFVQQQKLHKVNFIKIDVEGAEYDALKGCAVTLATYKPACILAIHPDAVKAKGDSLAQIYDLVLQLNYNPYYNNKLITKEAFCSHTDLLDLHLLPA